VQVPSARPRQSPPPVPPHPPQARRRGQADALRQFDIGDAAFRLQFCQQAPVNIIQIGHVAFAPRCSRLCKTRRSPYGNAACTIIPKKEEARRMARFANFIRSASNCPALQRALHAGV